MPGFRRPQHELDGINIRRIAAEMARALTTAAEIHGDIGFAGLRRGSSRNRLTSACSVFWLPFNASA